MDLIRDMLVEDAPLPPMVMLHGTEDTVVPHSVSEAMWAELQARRRREAGMHGSAGAPKDVFLSVAGGHHAFNFLLSARTLACGDALCDVLNEWFRVELQRRRAKSA